MERTIDELSLNGPPLEGIAGIEPGTVDSYLHLNSLNQVSPIEG